MGFFYVYCIVFAYAVALWAQVNDYDGDVVLLYTLLIVVFLAVQLAKSWL